MHYFIFGYNYSNYLHLYFNAPKITSKISERVFETGGDSRLR